MNGRRTMTLSIHLGVHKTATTHLQHSVRRIEQDLLDADRIFLGPDSLRDAPLDLRALLNRPQATPKRATLARDLLRSLRDEHAALTLSDELILGGLGRERMLADDGSFYRDAQMRLGNLLDLLGTRDVDLFLALRAPASFVTSVHGELTRQGGAGSLQDYLGDFDVGTAQWQPLVMRLLSVMGQGRLTIWRFEDTGRVRDRLLTRMLGAELAALVPNPPPLRVGLSAAAYRHLEKAGQGASQDDRRRQAEMALRQHPQRRPDQRLRLLDDAVHDRSAATYDRDCDRIAALPQVDFLRPGDGDAAQG